MDEILERFAKILNIDVVDLNNLVEQIMQNKNYEEELLNLFGYDNFDDVGFIIKNHHSKKKTESKRSDEIKIHENYVEISINPPKPLKNNFLVSIDRLSQNHRKYFDFKQFNSIQSTVFETAYMTDNNFLVAAPTGCGKTNIAVLAIIKAIEKEGKIVIIVPMKALATELRQKLENLFHNDHKVLEYTG